MQDSSRSSPTIGIFGDLTVLTYADGRTSLVRGDQREVLSQPAPPAEKTTLPAPVSQRMPLGLRAAATLLVAATLLRGLGDVVRDSRPRWGSSWRRWWQRMLGKR